MASLSEAYSLEPRTRRPVLPVTTVVCKQFFFFDL